MKTTNHFVKEIAAEEAEEAKEVIANLGDARRQISEIGIEFQLAPGEVLFVEPDPDLDAEDRQAAADIGVELGKISEQLEAIEARLKEIFEP